jgi:hypothetical protein
MKLRRFSVDENELELQLAKALESRESCQAEIKRIEKIYTTLLCPKGKSICEPAYCTFQITGTCPFLDKWRSIAKKYKLQKPDC